MNKPKREKRNIFIVFIYAVFVAEMEVGETYQMIDTCPPNGFTAHY